MRAVAFCLTAMMLLAGCAGTPEESTDIVGDEAFEEFELDDTSDALGIIRGVVVDVAFSPLAGAIVTLLNHDQQVTTNADGAFAFKELEAGAYFIQINKTGYGSAQTSTEVTAGIKDPELVRVLLERVSGTVPMLASDKFDGFITCSIRIPTLGFIDGCGVFGNLGIGSTQRRDYAFETGNIQWIQTDLTWTPNMDTAKEFCVSIGGASASAPPCGPDNLVHSIDKTAVEEDGLHKGEEFNHITYPNHYLADASGNLIVQQSFEVFAHAFYNFTPDEGWSFVVDGEHAVPA
jgi:hypothetical protein